MLDLLLTHLHIAVVVKLELAIQEAAVWVVADAC